MVLVALTGVEPVFFRILAFPVSYEIAIAGIILSAGISGRLYKICTRILCFGTGAMAAAFFNGLPLTARSEMQFHGVYA